MLSPLYPQQPSPSLKSPFSTLTPLFVTHWVNLGLANECGWSCHWSLTGSTHEVQDNDSSPSNSQWPIPFCLVGFVCMKVKVKTKTKDPIKVDLFVFSAFLLFNYSFNWVSSTPYSSCFSTARTAHLRPCLRTKRKKHNHLIFKLKVQFLIPPPLFPFFQGRQG